MRRFANLDLILVLVIVFSVGLIGYRILGSNKRSGSVSTPSDSNDLNSLPTKTAEEIREELRKDALNQRYGKAYGIRIQRLASTHWQLDADKWQQAISNPEVRSKMVEATDACRTDAQQLPAIYVIAPELRSNFDKNTPEIVFDIGSSRCLKVGQTIAVIYMNLAIPGDNLDRPFLEYAGTSQIESLLQLNRATSTGSLLQVLGETKEFLENEFFVGVENPKISYTLVRIGARNKSTKPKMIHFFPRTKILSKSNLKTMLESTDPVTVVDVRGADEIAAQPLAELLTKQSLSVPFSLAGSHSNGPLEFRWEMTLKQIQGVNFDVGRLLKLENSNRKTVFVFIGASSSDARPLLAIKEAFESGLENLAWYPDGASVLPNGIQ